MSNSKNVKAHTALLLTNFFFGANFSVIKLLTPVLIAPFALTFIRAGFSVLLFWLLFSLKPGKSGFHKYDLLRFIICAACGVTFNQLLFMKGLSLTTGIHGSLLMLVSPIFITLIAAVLLKEKAGIFKIAGMLFGISGAVVLILSKESSVSGSDVLTGDLFIAVNAIIYAFYMVMVKPLMRNYKAIHVMRWVFTFGFFMMIPIAWNDFYNTSFSSFRLIDWLCVLFVSLCGTFLPYLLNGYALSKLNASIAGIYMYTQPVFATIIAMIFLGEHFDLTKAVCALMIFAGVFLSTYTMPQTKNFK